MQFRPNRRLETKQTQDKNRNKVLTLLIGRSTLETTHMLFNPLATVISQNNKMESRTAFTTLDVAELHQTRSQCSHTRGIEKRKHPAGITQN